MGAIINGVRKKERSTLFPGEGVLTSKAITKPKISSKDTAMTTYTMVFLSGFRKEDEVKSLI